MLPNPEALKKKAYLKDSNSNDMMYKIKISSRLVKFKVKGVEIKKMEYFPISTS